MPDLLPALLSAHGKIQGLSSPTTVLPCSPATSIASSTTTGTSSSVEASTLKRSCAFPECKTVATSVSAWKRCSRCGQSRYCSIACQRSDWPRHKTVCDPALKKPTVAAEIDRDATWLLKHRDLLVAEYIKGRAQFGRGLLFCTDIQTMIKTAHPFLVAMLKAKRPELAAATHATHATPVCKYMAVDALQTVQVRPENVKWIQTAPETDIFIATASSSNSSSNANDSKDTSNDTSKDTSKDTKDTSKVSSEHSGPKHGGEMTIFRLQNGLEMLKRCKDAKEVRSLIASCNT